MLLKQIPGGGVQSLIFSPDGSILYSGDSRGWVSAWYRAADEQRKLFRLRGQLSSDICRLAVTGNNRLLLAGTPGLFAVWDTETRECWPSNPALPRDCLFALSVDDQTVAAVKDYNRIVFSDLAHRGTDSARPALQMPDKVWYLLFSPTDGSLAVVAGGGLYLLEPETERLIRMNCSDAEQLNCSPLGHPLAYSTDGKMLAVASECSILLWDVATRKLRQTIKTGRAYVRQLAFHPDGKILASAGDTPVVTLFDVASGKAIHRLNWGLGSKILSLAFSPDGMTAAAGGSNRKFVIWDLDGC